MKHNTLLAILAGLAPALAAPSPQDPLADPPAIECAPFPDPLPSWDAYPLQPSLPDPFLPLHYMSTAGANGTTPADIMAGRGPNRIRTPEEWYQCQQPQLLRMLQEYQYGYYPDHTLETVSARRTGSTVAVEVEVGGKTGGFDVRVQLPAGEGPFPVVIAIGGVPSQVFLGAGIAVAEFDYMAVAADSSARTGAFWDIYGDRDIGVLTAWAWGFHRTLDALTATYPELLPAVAVTGCSRLGKAALAASLLSPRITLTIPMSSGVQGLGPYRYFSLSGQGENLDNSKGGAPWWSAERLGEFVGRHERLPFDAHTVAAAIAPRALVADQGVGDQFVNSEGTGRVVFPAAKVVYDFLGAGDKLAIAIRQGGHCDMSGYENVLPFVRHILLDEPLARDYHDLGPYESALAEAFPWAETAPTGDA